MMKIDGKPMLVCGRPVQCATCKVWSPNPKPGSTNGQCRRLPPTLVRTDRGMNALWPMTEPDMWCGEHIASVEEASAE